MAKILVIDDDRDTVRSTVDALEEAGHDVRGEVGWRGVPRALHDFLPDAIVLDLLMPEISGRELLEMLRCHPDAVIRAIPIIVVTGTGERKTKQWALSHGASAWLAKPVDLEALVEALVETLQGIVGE